MLSGHDGHMNTGEPRKEASRVDAPLLNALLGREEPVGVEELGRLMSCSSAVVRDRLERLRRAGCELETQGYGRVRLASSELGVWSDYLEWVGRGRWRVVVYRKTSSTQDAVRRLVEGERSAEGSSDDRFWVAAADEQTAGRGRLGRRWYAPRGACLMFSRSMSSVKAGEQATCDRLTLASAVAIARTIEAASGEDHREVRIKWPNDILVDGRKIAGILVERFSGGERGWSASVIGVGINVGLTERHVREAGRSFANMEYPLTSLAMLGRNVERLWLLRSALEEMDRAFGEEDGELLAAWRKRSGLLGQRVEVVEDGCVVSGEVIDLDPRDGLVLRTARGTIVHLPAATSTLRGGSADV